MPLSFEGAAHFTHGDSAADAVRQQGALVVHRTRDLLTVGPCSADPVRHVALRRAHWGIGDGDGDAREESVVNSPPAGAANVGSARDGSFIPGGQAARDSSAHDASAAHDGSPAHHPGAPPELGSPHDVGPQHHVASAGDVSAAHDVSSSHAAPPALAVPAAVAVPAALVPSTLSPIHVIDSGDDDLAAAIAALPADCPLVLWAARAWSDQLWLWRTLDALDHAGVDHTRIWWAAPATYHPLASAGAATPAALVAALARAERVTPGLARECRTLWRKYAAPSPLAFDQARRAGSTLLPDLPQIAAPHGDWFPQRSDGQLHLSQLDALLLSCVGDDWRTPYDLLRDPRGEELIERLFLPYGDLFLLSRLAAWADHRGLDREARGDHAWSGSAYRLTPSGRRRLDRLDDVAEAPPLDVGGCRVNDSSTPWTRLIDGADWSLTVGQ